MMENVTFFHKLNASSGRKRQAALGPFIPCTWCRYLFNWYFQQDGTIEYEIKLTGELSTNMLSQGEREPEFGTLVAPGVNAQHHQHMFCARLDMAVDDPAGGAGLVVVEVHTYSLLKAKIMQL